jgi:tRNA(fMet)-specific endonuclease VapC
MRYLLDTNVCVDYLTGRYPRVTRRIQQAQPDDVCVSSVAVAELRYGAEKSARRQQNHERLDIFLREVACVDFDSNAASVYGRIRAGLEKKGVVIGPYDLQIGAHALSLGLVLVSDNVREFRRVSGLKVENWRRRQ